MSHDPLCGPPWSYGKGGHCEGCDLIARARADEREKAAESIPVLFALAPFIYPNDNAAIEFAQDWLRNGGPHV